MSKNYEYKFVRLGEGRSSALFGPATARGRTTRTRSRTTGVRAGVSCRSLLPGVAAFGAAKYYELIFERERVEDAAAA